MSRPQASFVFSRALDCGGASRVELGNPDAWPSTGVTEGCQFDAGRFHFTVMMKFDFDRYRIELAPEEVRLSLSHDAAEGPFWVWAPTAFNVTNGIGNVMQDHSNLWLKVKLQGHTGWIRGNESFAAIGLPPPNDPSTFTSSSGPHPRVLNERRCCV